MGTGHSETHYRYRVVRLKEYDETVNNESIEVLYFKEAKDIQNELGISKCSIFNIIKGGDNHVVKKFKNYFITKCREPVYSKLLIEYVYD